ncbi:polyphosphate kinase 2 [Novosphingobium sp. ZN18A2]|uniref:polyphosphate kinase 2 n=1 Tax=Novosphingobium sp. ZN18A2 TaxID=3079861 RepID=UPI0030D4C7C8
MGKAERKAYEDAIEPMQEELVGAARWAAKKGARVLVILEGRDTAGKSGVIHAILEKLNPRQCRSVALPKPSDRERGEWYFQRYVQHLPSAGEIVLFDRSWYNRAGVEKVMGFATDRQVRDFLAQAPVFEKLLVDDGILLFKYWLTADQKEQEKRFKERLDDPLKRWKLSPIDIEARQKYADYTKAREAMLAATHTQYAPWTLVNFNEQKRGRLTLIRDFLNRLPDTHVPLEDIDLPPLGHDPIKESCSLLKPLPDFPMD